MKQSFTLPNGALCRIRPLIPAEYPLLEEFLYLAIFVPKGAAPPSREILRKPELRVYIDGFGSQPGDHCMAAETGGQIIGAVWSRIMEDYGHIDDETPSLAISISPEYRSQGIGSRLMSGILERLRAEGYPKASLAVQKANYALKLYQKMGFYTVRETEEEYIMICDLMQ